MKNPKTGALLFLFLSLSIFMLYGQARAHGLGVFAYAHDGRIEVEGYFADGRPASKSVVSVGRPDSDDVLFEGTADEEGRYSFPAPVGGGPLKIVVDAGMGHQGTYIMSAGEVAEGLEGRAPEIVEEEAAGHEDSESHGHALSHEDEEVLRGLIREELEPVIKSVKRLELKKRRPGMTEIIGGLGYIVGILGIIFYIKARSELGGGK